MTSFCLVSAWTTPVQNGDASCDKLTLLERIVMAPLGTLVIGVGVFVASQYILKLILEPITRVRRAVADVSSLVLFRQAKITNGTYDPETAEELRRASSQLRGSIAEVRCYSFLSSLRIFGIPPRYAVRRSCQCLNLMAGTASDNKAERSQLVDRNIRALEELRSELQIDTTY
jgi:hypothetical protein